MEAVLRRGPDADYLFLINHGETAAEIEVAADASELLTGKGVVVGVGSGSVTVAAGDVLVVREPR